MKVQVIIDDNVVDRIDKQAHRKGLSRSAYCAQAIIQDMLHDEAQQKAMERLQGKLSTFGDVMGTNK